MAIMMPEDCKAFMCMPRPSQVCSLNQLLPSTSCQLQARDCDTTMTGSESATITQAEEEEGVESIFFEAAMPLVCLSFLGFEDLQYWSGNIVLETAYSPLATPSVLLRACQGPDCPRQSAGLPRGENPHSLGTHTKYLSGQVNPPFS
ncbi:hypothetical protein DSO57_1020551 [Entomophthora muscae]|uniref:Uncharacterized protein n=1 Tax=Entomophthora muscae TaxID=34485 RepID=A0ACC2TR06_9FUNG|nr:hypothetical protein DSO57_1020551 [Entomophthora muscae]